MPRYDYQCQGKCGREFEAFNNIGDRYRMSHCGLPAKLLVSQSMGTFNHFIPHTYTDLDVYPIHITGKMQLKRECKKRNLVAARLL